jgi:hypothetical protein
VGFDTTWGSSPTHTPRADPPSEQQVHSKVSLRRAVDAVQRVWSGACSNRPSDPTATTQAACEPGGGECGGVPVHPPRRHTHRTSPAQALLTMLTETC